VIKMATYEETKKALEGSIKKWELIVSGEETDNGTYNCPLCKLFLECEDGCPVEYDGYDGCSNPEFMDWYRHIKDNHPVEFENVDRRVLCDICKGHAVAELEYLRSLRSVVDEMFADENE
jgi:hypothetical protein